MGSIPGSGRSLQEAMATNSSILPWGSHGQRSLAGYSPQQHKGLDTHAHNANMKITFFRPVAQSYLTLCDPMNRSTPGLPVHHQLLESTQTMSTESVMPSNRLILCCPLLLLPSIFPSIGVFSNESALHIGWPKYWSFTSVLPMNIQG